MKNGIESPTLVWLLLYGNVGENGTGYLQVQHGSIIVTFNNSNNVFHLFSIFCSNIFYLVLNNNS